MSASRTCQLESIALIIRDVAIFCLTYGGHLYAGWDATKLFKYLSFQWLSGNVVLVHDGAEIAGVFVAWRDFASEIARREHAKEFHFNWRSNIEGGDALLIADVIVNKQGNNLTRLLQLASATWPDWKMRRLFTHRRGELVELAPAVTARFFHEQS
jgi:hypothetical protein